MNKPLSNLSSVIKPYKDLLLTSDGFLAIFELDGVDPDGFQDDDFRLKMISDRNRLSVFDERYHIQNWNIHVHHAKLAQDDIESDSLGIDDYLIYSRKRYLDNRVLYKTRLFMAVSVGGVVKQASLGPFIKDLLKGDFGGLSFNEAYVAEQKKLHFEYVQLKEQSDKFLSLLNSSLNGPDKSKLLSHSESFSFLKFLASGDREYLNFNAVDYPDDHWYSCLLAGRCSQIKVNSTDALKFDDRDSRYLRCASITSFGSSVKAGMFHQISNPLFGVDVEYIVYSQFKPFSRFATASLFDSHKRDIERKNIKVVKTLSDSFSEQKARQDDSSSRLDYRSQLQMQELEKASSLKERWGEFAFSVFVLSNSSESLFDSSRKIDFSLASSGLGYTWEGPGLIRAYQACQAGGAGKSRRSRYENSMRVSAMSVDFSSNVGVDVNDKPLFLLETVDGQPFGYSPFVAEKSLVIADGPTRSGKTFLKNAIAEHFIAQGGETVFLDIDQGSYPIADIFDNTAIYELPGDGMNPFSSYDQMSEKSFFIHFTSLVRYLISTNDDPALASYAEGDQAIIEGAIQKCIYNFPSDGIKRTFQLFYKHLSLSLRKKFDRWVSGVYSGVFNAEDDLYSTHHRNTIFNLKSIYKAGDKSSDNHVFLAVYKELLYRVSTRFEDESRRLLKSRLIIDEAHAPLSNKETANWLEGKAVTWNKYSSSLELWTQNPAHYLNVDNWPALRSSASTMLFFANPSLDESLYKSTYLLTDSEISTIKHMQARRDVFLIQRDIGVSKRLIFNPEKLLITLNSSRPDDVALRNSILNTDGDLRSKLVSLGGF